MSFRFFHRPKNADSLTEGRLRDVSMRAASTTTWPVLPSLSLGVFFKGLNMPFSYLIRIELRSFLFDLF
jgi:hypothetical protein